MGTQRLLATPPPSGVPLSGPCCYGSVPQAPPSPFGRSLPDTCLPQMLWDHLLCAEPTMLLLALTAFAKMNASALLLARTPDDVSATLLRESAVQMRAWLRCMYALAATCGGWDLNPRWRARPSPSD